MKKIPFNELPSCDLIVDAVYEGGSSGNISDDPISKLLPGCGNQGGFRYVGKGIDKKFVVLYTSAGDKDWPDGMDLKSGQLIYYGDNKTPGHELHETRRKGNLILQNVFNYIHSANPLRQMVPPFFVFQRCPTADSSRSVQFKGLAVPGYPGTMATEDLVAIWKTTEAQRFQNYRATFTILDAAVIPRQWMEDLTDGISESGSAPRSWTLWRNTGRYTPLISELTTTIRSIEAQSPQNQQQANIIETIFEYFRDSPYAFEAFAAKIYQMQDSRVVVDEITRGVVDGGRDAVGRYLLGLPTDPVTVEFSLEAKCYRPPTSGNTANTVGVREVSRLISRLRHRQFGVMVTTSVIARQAYEEVREDGHPVIFLCARDIAEILIEKGINTPDLVSEMLSSEL